MLYKNYHSTESLEEALTLLTNSGGSLIQVIAGGTDLMLQLNERLATADTFVDISSIPELLEVSLEKKTIRIGACVTYRNIICSDLLKRHAFLLVEASKSIGAAQIQNMGTIGGNIVNASPAGDMIPCLNALDAEITLSSREGERSIPIGEFYLGYRQTSCRSNELVKEISFQSLPPDSASAFVKFGLRQSQAIAVVNVAIVLQIQGGTITRASVALGAVAPTIVRSFSAEKLLINQEPSLDLFERAGEAARDDISPINDIRGSADFRKYITRPLVKRALESAWIRTGNA